MSMKLEQTPQAKLKAVTAEMINAQTLFQSFNHKLKQFDFEHPILDAELEQERESLRILYQQALENLREKEEIQKFMHHELFAMNQQWGRGPEPWRR